MKSITYVGPFTQGVVIEPHPKTQSDVWVLVKPGEAVECDGSVADSLVQQDVWSFDPLADAATDRPTARSSVAEWQAFIDLHGLDPEPTGKRTKAELIALAEEFPTTAQEG